MAKDADDFDLSGVIKLPEGTAVTVQPNTSSAWVRGIKGSNGGQFLVGGRWVDDSTTEAVVHLDASAEAVLGRPMAKLMEEIHGKPMPDGAWISWRQLPFTD